MKLLDDIKDTRLLHLKGGLFLLVAVIAAAELVLQSPEWLTVFQIVALIWGACRFYYYLFYVLEKYAGRERRYSGITDEIRHLLTRRRKP